MKHVVGLALVATLFAIPGHAVQAAPQQAKTVKPKPAVTKPTAPAAQPRQAGEAPAIELAVAVANATAFLQAKKISTSRQYLESAVFDKIARRWTITWQVANAKGGTTWVLVPEIGDISVSFGE